MKKAIISALLVMILAVALAGPTLAAPPAGTAEGVFVFGEFAPILLLYPVDAPIVGVGFGTEIFSLGVEAQIAEGSVIFGGFAGASLGMFGLEGEILTIEGVIVGKALGLVKLDLDLVALGIGGGMFFMSNGIDPPESTPLVTAEVSFGLDAFSIYGGVDYLIEPGFLTYRAGVAYAF